MTEKNSLEREPTARESVLRAHAWQVRNADEALRGGRITKEGHDEAVSLADRAMERNLAALAALEHVEPTFGRYTMAQLLEVTREAPSEVGEEVDAQCRQVDSDLVRRGGGLPELGRVGEVSAADVIMQSYALEREEIRRFAGPLGPEGTKAATIAATTSLIRAMQAEQAARDHGQPVGNEPLASTVGRITEHRQEAARERQAQEREERVRDPFARNGGTKLVSTEDRFVEVNMGPTGDHVSSNGQDALELNDSEDDVQAKVQRAEQGLTPEGTETLRDASHDPVERQKDRFSEAARQQEPAAPARTMDREMAAHE